MREREREREAERKKYRHKERQTGGDKTYRPDKQTYKERERE